MTTQRQRILAALWEGDPVDDALPESVLATLTTLERLSIVALEREPWRARAACLGAGTDDWFPLRPRGTSGPSETPAFEVCAGCPVRRDCFEYACRNGEQSGVWGGVEFIRGVPRG